MKGSHSRRGYGPGGMGRRVTVALSATLAALLLLAATAQAAPPVTIAGFGEGAGEVRNPKGVAVDQSSDDLYVADRNNFRILRFDSEGEFLLGWGWGVADGASQELQTCGPEASPPTKRCFQAAREGPLELTARGPGAVVPEAVAVDQSSGDLYVADIANRRVSKFTSSGELIFMVGKNVNTSGVSQAERNICTAADVEAGDLCGRAEAGNGPGEFSRPASLAIDAAGDVWVGDIDRIQELSPDGTFASEVSLPGAGETKSLALDSAGNFYVKSQELPGIRKLQAGTGTLLETLAAGVQPRTVTVDAAENVYVRHCVTSSFDCSTHPYRFMVFNPAGEQVSQFGAGQVIGTPGGEPGPSGGSNALAVADSAGTLYVASSQPTQARSAVQAFPIPEPGPLIEAQRVEDLLPTTATLLADLNPEGNQTTYHFQYGTTDSYGQSTETKTLPGTGYDEEEVKAEIAQLIPGTTYHLRLVATNHCKATEPAVECTVEGPDTTFTTLPAVGIEAQWATGVAATSATLHAELDPLGVEAEWWLEYGTSPCSEGGCEETAESALLASFGAIPVALTLTGLEPGTTYHYRFAARDERDGATYVVHGSDRSFTTQLGGLGFELPDERAWEMVSPSNKFGGRIGVRVNMDAHFQAAADGDAVTYLSLGSIEADPEGNRGADESSVLSRRGAGGEWSSKDISPPHTEATPLSIGQGLEYKLFSTELDEALLEPRDTTLLSPKASERAPYLRENTEPPGYEPLVTGKAPFANVPEGTKFGGNPRVNVGEVRVRSATADLRHVVLKSGVPLATGAATGSLYAWSEGRPPAEQLHLASVLPSGEAVTAEAGSGRASVRHAISEGGTRVFWSHVDGGGNPTGLYLRDIEREETIRLDVVQPGASGTGAATPRFLGADAQGAVAYFTDSRQLTADASESGRDLYRCEVVVEGGQLKCQLTDITAVAGEDAEVQGIAPGMSEDGSHLYFVAKGVLDPDPNEHGDSAVQGQPNLYLWREGEGIHFIATLAQADERDWGLPAPTETPFAFDLSAAASPSGRYLGFMSQRPLTGYDNRDAGSGELAQEVFRYDAEEEDLTCVSCNPSGARPAALIAGEGLEGLAQEFDPQKLWSGQTVAAVLPEATRLATGDLSLYRTRSVHDNGRVFFNAADSLVPADSNGNGDVYQYEPLGMGSCEASSGGAGVARIEGGCVALISSGTAEGTSAFLDASVGGDDVFFYSPAQLSVTDADQVMDIYDARVGGIAATIAPRTECLGEACQPAAIVPSDPTPASAGFRGAGNVPPQARKRCPKAKRRVTRKGKTRCVTRNQARKAKRERANRDRRAGR